MKKMKKNQIKSNGLHEMKIYICNDMILVVGKIYMDFMLVINVHE